MKVSMALAVVIVLPGAVVAPGPFPDHTRRQDQDDHTDGLLRAALEPGRQLGLEEDQRQPDGQQHHRVAKAPPGAHAGRVAVVGVVRSDQRGDRDEVIGIRGMAHSEYEGDSQRHQQRRAVEEVRQRLVQLLDRPEQELEAH